MVRAGATIAAMAIVVSCATSFAAAADGPLPPRLWEATRARTGGPPQVLYLLGVTHPGYPAERDAYLSEVVLPRARTAARLLYEGAGPAEPYWSRPACDTPLGTAAARDAADALRDRAARLLAARDDAPDALEAARRRVAPLSELGLAALVGLVERDGDPGVDSGFVPVVDVLRREHRFAAIEDVDRPGEMDRGYCALGDERVALLAQWTAAPARSREMPSAADVSALQDDLRETLERGRPAGRWAQDSATFDERLVCGRNARWLARMREDTSTAPALYALGLAHLLPVRDGRCGGLLADLRAAGYEVTRVER